MKAIRQFQNMSVRTKFFLLIGVVSIAAAFSMFGMVQLRLISHFQDLERDHIVLVTGLQTHLDTYRHFLEEGSGEAAASAKALLRRQANTPQSVLEKGILQIFEDMQVVENRVFEDTTVFDRMLFQLFGFGGIFGSG